MWEFSARLEEIDVEKLIHNATFLLDHQDTYRELITEHASELKLEALRNVELLKEHFVR